MPKAKTITAPKETKVEIRPPNFQVATFTIQGDSPLVIHRMSAKLKSDFLEKVKAGSVVKKKIRDPQDPLEIFNQARYVSPEGWDGFHAAAIRCGLISACRLVGYPMSRAKLSLFVLQDGWDKIEPQIPLIRILKAKPVMQQDVGRVETGQPYLIFRPAYHGWEANVRLRWDADQFTIESVLNLLARVGGQVGLGEGRPDSKNSSGMGWGTFTVRGGTIQATSSSGRRAA